MRRAARSISFSISSIIGLASPPATAAPRAWRCAPMSVADFYARVHGPAAAPRHRRAHLDDAERDRERGSVRAGSHARAVRSGLCRALLAGAGAGGPGAEGVSRPLHRQGQPGAFLLGQLRPRGDALFRPHGAAADGRHAQRRQLGDGGGLFARGLELRLLAGQRRLRPRRLLRLRLSGARRATATRRCARRGPSTTRTSASSSCRTTRCARRAIPTRCCSASCRKPTPPPPIWRNGTARRSNAPAEKSA